jgi:hypothetical protein
MADIKDVINAEKETDLQVEKLSRLAGTGNVSLALILGITTLVAAIRELGIRLDYVARD